MSVSSLLLRDPPFWVASFVLAISLGVTAWCLRQLSLNSKSTRPAVPPREIPPDPVEPRLIEKGPPSGPAAPASLRPANTADDDMAALMTVVEEKMSEILKRVAALERRPEAAPSPGLDIQPLLGRLEELSAEMGKIKLFLADSPPPFDPADILRRVAAVEKTAAAPAAGPSVDLAPVMNRLNQFEQDLIKMKQYLAELPSAHAAAGTSEETASLARKVESLQKLLENLTAETETAKPS